MKTLIARLAGAGVLAGLALAMFFVPEGVRQAIGAVVAVAGVLLLVIARVHLGRSFSVRLQARDLVTTGLYARIQHPLFLFLDISLLALIVVFNLPWLLIAWYMLIVIHVLECRREERFLLSAFGSRYTSYQAGTWI